MIRETYKLVKTVKKMYPVVQFLKDRYFPDGPVYYSEKALIEFKKKGRKIAPFVIPLVNGIVMEKDGYRTDIVDAPYIAPKRVITAKELEQKAFGESPESGRSPEQRENELESEFIDDNRISILRRHEKMCADILLTGQVIMKHYATAEDAAKGENYDFKYLRFYEGEFKNKYKFTKKFKDMTTAEKIQEFYKMATVLRKRGVRATDIVMTSDVSMLLMSDKDFLEFYNKAKVNIGEINPTELPDGVVSNGSININGVVMTLFTYDEIYEDLDGEEKAILPAGTIAFLQPNMGTTVYAQVTFYTKDGFKSYAEKIVPRLVGDEKSNMAEVQAFSRPVMYPNDMDVVVMIADEDVVDDEWRVEVHFSINIEDMDNDHSGWVNVMYLMNEIYRHFIKVGIVGRHTRMERKAHKRFNPNVLYPYFESDLITYWTLPTPCEEFDEMEVSI